MRLSSKLLSSSVALILASMNANAAGYSTNLTSTSALANSYAGSAVGAHDISNMFYNAATISNHDKAQFVFSLSHLDLDIDPDNVSFNNSSSGNELGDAGEDAQVPAIYFSTPINDVVSFGLAVNSPFGLATKYSESWQGRESSSESNISTININPNISFKINDDLSLGLGLQAQYTKTAFTKVAAGNLAKTHANDWGHGYNLGLKYNLNEDLKFGLGYRSKITHKFVGNTNAPGIGNSAVTFVTDTPESVTAGLGYQAKDNLEVAFDITWTRWSRLQQLSFSHATISAIDSASTINYHMKDSFLYSLGLNYDLNQDILLRFGTAYEKAAVTDSYRNFTIPVGDRIWASTGIRYQLLSDLALDATYMHQFYKNVSVNTSDNVGNNLYGQFRTDVDVVSIGLKKDF